MKHISLSSCVTMFISILSLISPANLLTLSCFVNVNGPCNTGALTMGQVDMNAYVGRYNKYVKSCNFNPVADLSSADLLPPIVDSVLDMSCDGFVLPSLNYSFTKQCGLMETYATLYACINANDAKYKYLLNTNETFTIIVYNLPLKCPWLGLGTIPQETQSSRYNSVWIQGERMRNINYTNTLVHELGHTKRLQHAGAFGSTWEYADCSCPMGCAKDINLCFNAPNANRLGWAKPIFIDQTLQNYWMTVFVPIYTTAFSNHVMIQVTSDCALYFSVRSSLGGPADSSVSGLTVVNYVKNYVPVENALGIHAMNASSNRAMAVDFLSESKTKIWDFAGIANNVCGNTVIDMLKKLAIVHHEFIQSEGGSLVSFCFYGKTVGNCY